MYKPGNFFTTLHEKYFTLVFIYHFGNDGSVADFLFLEFLKQVWSTNRNSLDMATHMGIFCRKNQLRRSLIEEMTWPISINKYEMACSTMLFVVYSTQDLISFPMG